VDAPERTVTLGHSKFGGNELAAIASPPPELLEANSEGIEGKEGVEQAPPKSATDANAAPVPSRRESETQHRYLLTLALIITIIAPPPGSAYSRSIVVTLGRALVQILAAC
jgi:hypothetical protein